MSWKVYSIDDHGAYASASNDELIELLPQEGKHPLFIPKWILESVAYGIAKGEFIHLSGPTGVAKTSMIEAIWRREENFQHVCRYLDIDVRPLQVFPIEMVNFELPGELLQRRAIVNGETVDQESVLVQAMRQASVLSEKQYCLIWLREIGRVHSANVQGGLLNLMAKPEAILPEGQRIPISKVSWIADSNYQAQEDDRHVLAAFDDAVKRRFRINVTMDYLPKSYEKEIVQRIVRESVKTADEKRLTGLTDRIVELGSLLRKKRREGTLRTVIPQTIYGYVSFVIFALEMPALSETEAAMATVLGNASTADTKEALSLFMEVFGLSKDAGEDPVVSKNLL